MDEFSFTHLADRSLLEDFEICIRKDCATTAGLLARLAEIDSRRLYAPLGYPSMFEFCVRKYGFAEEVAYKRIQVARAARAFPAIFRAIADGRLNLTAVVILAPHLTEQTADDLLSRASGKSISDVKVLLAHHAPKPDVPAGVLPLLSECTDVVPTSQLDLNPVEVTPKTPSVRPPTLAPLAPQRFVFQVTIDQAAYERLQHVRGLLAHQIPSGDLAQVLSRVLDIAAVHLEKRKFAATSRTRKGPTRSQSDARYIPAAVRCDVMKPDGGRCTFVAGDGQRCAATSMLEFDHRLPVARGGRSTVESVTLRCRAHNQYAAECEFGREFMDRKRAAARASAAERRSAATVRRHEISDDPTDSVIPWLRRLGCNAEEVRRAAAACEDMQGASLEERLRVALKQLRPVFRVEDYRSDRASAAAAASP